MDVVIPRKGREYFPNAVREEMLQVMEGRRDDKSSSGGKGDSALDYDRCNLRLLQFAQSFSEVFFLQTHS